MPTNDPRIEAATQAVYDCVMPDGDCVAELIHMSDLIHDDVPLADQIQQVRDICRTIAIAAITAHDEADQIARAREIMDRPESVAISKLLRERGD